MKWIENARKKVKSQGQKAEIILGTASEEDDEYNGIIIEESTYSNDDDVEPVTYIEEHEGELGDDDYVEEMEIEWLHK